MKIAISSTGKDLQSAVDPRFGRAAYLLIVETDTMSLVEVIDNSEAVSLAHGAGISAASRIADAGARAVLSGIVGPKAAAVCEKAGIAMVSGASGTVREAVEDFVNEYDLENIPQAEQQMTSSPVKKKLPLAGQPGAGRGRGMGRGMGGGMGLGGGRRRGQCRNI